MLNPCPFASFHRLVTCKNDKTSKKFQKPQKLRSQKKKENKNKTLFSTLKFSGWYERQLARWYNCLILYPPILYIVAWEMWSFVSGVFIKFLLVTVYWQTHKCVAFMENTLKFRQVISLKWEVKVITPQEERPWKPASRRVRQFWSTYSKMKSTWKSLNCTDDRRNLSPELNLLMMSPHFLI